MVIQFIHHIDIITYNLNQYAFYLLLNLFLKNKLSNFRKLFRDPALLPAV